MHLENLVVDAVQPQRLGRFWAAAVGGEPLTDEPDIHETRLGVDGGPVLDLCFQPVPDLPTSPPRLHVDLAGGAHPADVVDRLLDLGATRLDAAGPWALLADPEGNPFRVLDGGPAATGPIAALALDSTDPARDAAFWSWLTGWTASTGAAAEQLRHPSRRGPALKLRPQAAAKGPAKNRRHLDLRLEAGDDPDDVHAGITRRGGREWFPQWGELPWRFYLDPSGNEFCVLPARS